MSLSETKSFLVDLITRFDASLDTSDGSRVMAELVEPILARVGPDPFDDDVVTFIRERLRQARPDLAITEADELTDLLIDPMRVLLEPLTREIKLVKLRQSLRNLDALADDEVDALMGNFFSPRQGGSYSTGTARAYFASPQTITISMIHIGLTKSGLRFLPSRPQQILADQMLLNVDGSEYYADFAYIAEKRGSEYDIDPDEIYTITNLPTATRVRNIRRFRGGSARETSQEFVARVQESTSDKTLTTQPGILAVLGENFPDLRQIFQVGMGDAEMQRDVIRGGSLGTIPDDDDLGSYFGTGGPTDDLDADTTSCILSASTGNFTTRIGAIGTEPTNWYVSLIYTTGGTLVVVDAQVLEVLSATTISTDHEMPLTLGGTEVTWALRKKSISISEIPGGILFPDSVTGNLEIDSDEVHIGGKTDIYVASTTESASAQITSLSDESPLVRGFDAQTQAGTSGQEAVVILADADADLFAEIEPGMSLVLSEGVDAGAYRILATDAGDSSVTLDTEMTGTAANITWRIVDELDVNLMEPRDILVTGSDILMSAGSDSVTTVSSLNFADAGVTVGDTLTVTHDLGGGEFTITEVDAVTLKLSPSATRTIVEAPYVISRNFEGVQAPVVRISSIELLDSAGAPTGTTIPYRDPVLVTSNAFQNEGSSYVYEGPVFAGLVGSALTGTIAVSGLTLTWETYDPDARWDGTLASGTFSFGVVVPQTLTQIVALLNASSGLQAADIRASVVSYQGSSYLGLTSPHLLRVTGGTAITLLGLITNQENNCLWGVSGADFNDLRIRRGDLVEFVDGNNSGRGVRVIVDPTEDANGLYKITVGTGPLGPSGTSALYNNAVLNPEAGSRVRIARPSVGSARVYFLEPTSVEFPYQSTRFTVDYQGQELVYMPDPENLRTVRPAAPSTTLPDTGETNSSLNALVDTSADFLLWEIQSGDIVDLLYVPITGTGALASTTLVNGLTLILRLDNDPYITVTFPYDMPRADVPDYINEQVGEDIAELDGSNQLVLSSSQRIEISSASTALTALSLATLTSDHPEKGSYVVAAVPTSTQLTFADETPVSQDTSDSIYRIRRYVQRFSSTEMNENLDASGLYYVDVEAVSTLPGNYHNIGTGIELTATGYDSDGYSLSTDNETTSYSRGEVLRATFSTSMLLVGSADSPEEAVQLHQQSIQVNYERSPAVDDVQSFCDSEFRRVLCEEILVRHMLPHYVSLNWCYIGGAAEAAMKRALIAYLDGVAGGEELEVGDLTDVLRKLQATSIYTPDTTATLGRSAPLVLVVSHGLDRKITGSLVRDIVDTVRTQRYIPDTLTLRRVSSSGLR